MRPKPTKEPFRRYCVLQNVIRNALCNQCTWINWLCLFKSAKSTKIGRGNTSIRNCRIEDEKTNFTSFVFTINDITELYILDGSFYRVFFLLFRPKKWLSVRLHCKSHPKNLKCQNFFLYFWHLGHFKGGPLKKKKPVFRKYCTMKKTGSQGGIHAILLHILLFKFSMREKTEVPRLLR